MINWATINPAMVQLFSDLAGGMQTIWIDKKRPFIDPALQCVILLKIRQSMSIGVDDRRYIDLEVLKPDPTLVEKQVGHRRVTLEIRVESFRHDDDRFAFNTAELLRSKLRFMSSLDRLRALNIALISINDTVDFPNVIQDQRVTSIAVVEAVLNVGFEFADDGDAAHQIYNIESVENPLDNENTEFNLFNH